MSNALQTTKCTDTTKAESKKTHTETTEDKLEKKQQQKKIQTQTQSNPYPAVDKTDR